MLNISSNNLPVNPGYLPHINESIEAMSNADSIVEKVTRLFAGIILFPLNLVRDIADFSSKAANMLVKKEVQPKNSVMDKFFAMTSSAKVKLIAQQRHRKTLPKEIKQQLLKQHWSVLLSQL